MDVSPRTGPGLADADPGTPLDPTPRPARSRGKGLMATGLLVVVLGAIGFLLIKQLGSASLYYYNADVAVAKKAELADSRFRIQGTYRGRVTERTDGDIQFNIVFNGASVVVEHSGSQPALFKPGIPVVLDGRWSPDGSTFLSDRIEVKHTEVYKEKNPARVDPAAP